MSISSYFTGQTTAATGACGQVSPLTTQLRGILSDYSGQQFLNELLQNADDAGATEFAVCLDKRQHERGDSLLCPSMGEFQGPAILQYDNATFKPSDFESIQRLGDGLKHGDSTKTGQFGLGFNSCYHITDLPSFISGNFLVLFDPHRKYLPPNSANRESGLFYALRRKRDSSSEDIFIADEYRDQLKPYIGAFGCDGRGQWTQENGTKTNEGTIFRFPLRTPAVAKASEISKKAASNDLNGIYREIVEPFVEDMSHRLLFLKSIQKIRVYIHEQGEEGMRIVATAEAKNVRESDRINRKSQYEMLKRALDEAGKRAPRVDSDTYGSSNSFEMKETRFEQHVMALQSIKKVPSSICRPIFPLWIHSTTYQTSNPTATGTTHVRIVQQVEHFLISLGFGDENDIDFACSTAVQTHRLFFVPYAAVAARISCQTRQLQFQLAARAVSIPESLRVAMITISSPGSRQQTSHQYQQYAALIDTVSSALANTPFQIPPQPQPVNGRVFCCLPTSMLCGLPVHIDARWELTRSRNNFSGSFQQQPASGAVNSSNSSSNNMLSSVKADWNYRLASRVAAAAYARLLQVLVHADFIASIEWTDPLLTQGRVAASTPAGIDTDYYYLLFPAIQSSNNRHAISEPWLGLAGTLYGMMGSVLHPHWRQFYQHVQYNICNQADICFLRRYEPNSLAASRSNGVQKGYYGPKSAMFVPATPAGELKSLLELLLQRECPLTDAPAHILDALLVFAGDTIIKGMLSPANVRNWIKQLCSGPNAADRSFMWANVDWNEQTASIVLSYLVKDILNNDSPGTQAIDQLKEIPCIPVVVAGGASNECVQLMKPCFAVEYTIATDVDTFNPQVRVGPQSSNSMARQLFSFLQSCRTLQRRTQTQLETSCGIYLLTRPATAILRPLLGSLNIINLDLLCISPLVAEVFAALDSTTNSNYSASNDKQLLLFQGLELLWSFIEEEAMKSLMTMSTTSASPSQSVPSRLLQALEAFRYVPIIPCASRNSNVNDVALSLTMLENLRTVLPSPTSATSSQSLPSASSGTEGTILELLTELQVPILHSVFSNRIVSSFELLNRNPALQQQPWKCGQFTVVDVIYILSRLSPSSWKSVRERHRLAVLSFVSAWAASSAAMTSGFDGSNGSSVLVDTLHIVASLPLFRRESSSSLSISRDEDWTALQSTAVSAQDNSSRNAATVSTAFTQPTGREKWFTLPEFDDGQTSINPRQSTASIMPTGSNHCYYPFFLARPAPPYAALYTLLGIKPLPREQFYVSFVLPMRVWRALPTDEQVAHLQQIKNHFDSMCDKRVVIVESSGTTVLPPAASVASSSTSIAQAYPPPQPQAQVQSQSIRSRLVSAVASSVSSLGVTSANTNASVQSSQLPGQAQSHAESQSSVRTKLISEYGLVTETETADANQQLKPGSTLNFEDVRFGEFLSRLPIFQHGSSWLCAKQLVDARVPLLAHFFPHRLPPTYLTPSRNGNTVSIDNSDWHRFLVRLGMSETVNTDFLWQCAVAVDRSYKDYCQQQAQDVDAILYSARILVLYLLSNFDQIYGQLLSAPAASAPVGNTDADAPAREWFARLSMLSLAEVFCPIPRAVVSGLASKSRSITNASANHVLVPFRGALMRYGESERLFHSSWSQRQIIQVRNTAFMIELTYCNVNFMTYS
jgi:hypothetical protein